MHAPTYVPFVGGWAIRTTTNARTPMRLRTLISSVCLHALQTTAMRPQTPNLRKRRCTRTKVMIGHAFTPTTRTSPPQTSQPSSATSVTQPLWMHAKPSLPRRRLGALTAGCRFVSPSFKTTPTAPELYIADGRALTPAQHRIFNREITHAVLPRLLFFLRGAWAVCVGGAALVHVFVRRLRRPRGVFCWPAFLSAPLVPVFRCGRLPFRGQCPFFLYCLRFTGLVKAAPRGAVATGMNVSPSGVFLHPPCNH